MATKNPNLKPMKVKMSLARKLSIAVGLLSFVAFIVQGLGTTWGFESLSEQIVQTFLLVSGGINIFFLGDTTRKEVDEKKEQESNDSEG